MATKTKTTTNGTATNRTYQGLDAAYAHFNADLFGGTLPGCLITLTRKKGSLGYFSGDRFANRDDVEDTTDEIALNPCHFIDQSPRDILSTLVHEMAHLWQHHNGKPGRRGYHNQQWADKMLDLGLIPTATGLEGGPQTGEKMTHVVDARGRFAESCEEFMAAGNLTVFYQDLALPAEAKKKAESKTKYTCPVCEANAWAKPETRLTCGDCEEPMEPEAK